MLSLPVDTPSLVFLLFSAAAAGLARGFSGFGSALIFVPLASTAVGPLVAVPLLLVVDGITTLGLVAPAARLANRTDVARMALGALMGVPTGVWLLSRLDPLIIRWSIVAIVILLLALLMSGWRYRNQPKPPVTIAVGAVSGLLTGIAQIGGPPVIAYWLGGAVSAIVMRANFILYFAISTVLSAVGYVWSGLVTAEVLILAACMAPLYAIGVWLGSRMFGMASELTFRRICYAMIAAAAVFSMPILDGLLR